jgi:hypothetical protein
MTMSNIDSRLCHINLVVYVARVEYTWLEEPT